MPVIGAILWRRGTRPARSPRSRSSAVTVVALLFTKGIDSDAPIYGGLGLSFIVYMAFSLVGGGAAPPPLARCPIAPEEARAEP